MRSSRALFLIGFGCLGASVTARAHHSFGTFAGVDFVNPHTWVHIKARGADGNVAVERFSLNRHVRRGSQLTKPRAARPA
jgi:hypothetical protein